MTPSWFLCTLITGIAKGIGIDVAAVWGEALHEPWLFAIVPFAILVAALGRRGPRRRRRA